MRVSVVVPTYNRRDVLLPTIEALFRQEFPAGDYEIIVVVDGSADGTAGAVERLHPPCELRVLEQENRGLAAARNTGLFAARGDIVVFLDDDVRAVPGLLRTHVERHRSAGRPVMVIGALFLSQDSPCTLAADCFEAEIGRYYLLYRNAPVAPPLREWLFCNASIPRERGLQIGGFDPEFRMQREDQDFGYRLGLEILYAPDAIGYEFYCKTPAELLREAAAFARGDVLLLQKHPALLPESAFGRLLAQPVWKRGMHHVAVKTPWLADPLLRLLWRVAGRKRHDHWFRHAGMRALQWHRVLVWEREFRTQWRPLARGEDR
jgi:glycosyltransferase involved in cell wall biosynthesis